MEKINGRKGRIYACNPDRPNIEVFKAEIVVRDDEVVKGDFCEEDLGPDNVRIRAEENCKTV